MPQQLETRREMGRNHCWLFFTRDGFAGQAGGSPMGSAPLQNQVNYLTARTSLQHRGVAREQAELHRLPQQGRGCYRQRSQGLSTLPLAPKSLSSEPGGAAEEMCAFRQISSLSEHPFPEYRAVVRINDLIWLKCSGESLAFSNPQVKVKHQDLRAGNFAEASAPCSIGSQGRRVMSSERKVFTFPLRFLLSSEQLH